MGRRGAHRKFHEALCEELIAFAGRFFRDNRRWADGSTEKAHHEAAARIRSRLPGRGKAAPVAAPQACPWRVAYLWHWFIEVAAGASGGGGFGPVVVSWHDVAEWSRMTGTRPDPWEAALLIRLGNLRARIETEDADKNRPR